MTADNEPAVRPISSHDVAWTEWSDVPRFGVRYRHLTLAAMGEPYHVGVAIEELEPGRQSSPAHFHIFEEEHVFVLDGELTARVGVETHVMKAGDYICFPAGQRAGHCLLNTGTATARYVIIGERNPNEVVVYTDSNKVLVRALGRDAIFDLAAARSYWDGEVTGPDNPAFPRPDVIATLSQPAKPLLPISADDIPWNGDGAGPQFGGSSKHLTHAVAGRAYRVGVLIESPAPGMRLCPTHYHMLEEEHALVLEGELTLILGEERLPMKPGDYVCFPAGRKIGHSFVNSGTGPCRYLMIGERNPNEVCVYPDSNKMAVDALRVEPGVFDMSATRNYWDGEKTA
ncbi:cupin domain-containing protein [Labrys sp. La1]|uniref:cupin domain-containing protein n=1 Tax=Labrys sp. La1 TaxID=3404917 RepID=UPI003EB9F252